MSTTLKRERQKRTQKDCIMMNIMRTKRTKQPRGRALLWTAFLVGSCHGFVSRSPFLRGRTTAARHVGLSMPEHSNWTVSLAADDDEELMKASRPSAVNGALTVPSNKPDNHRKLDLFWCGAGGDSCKVSIRERVVGDNNSFEFDGPATGQVCFVWNDDGECQVDEDTASAKTASVLILVKRHDDELMRAAADAIKDLTESGIHVYLVPDQAAKIEHYYGAHNDKVHIFEPRATPGFGGSHVSHDDVWMLNRYEETSQKQSIAPDMICTLGGDGLLMHANVMFQGPVPPILCVAGVR
jgi:hypothetical protein